MGPSIKMAYAFLYQPHLFTHQEAVAIQLEEERLVKIKDVLKELPAPHYK